ncbi:LuxR C-terminal-related transcriptional regulator [Blastococcus brunescens]|uniref:LuxR C-terminal-related transcriptional regulator n=1 Tax=Blastococcus brunescens TaxID=1564165 RepID=A0ABZ1B3C2_9ACTN|nr:LuxR C-terminal-related transcriptional regulator [Blastococcus sp. BMG 8361]WRL65307.1 LuxR C-terminal-related transcriptional regulator [Blastococcus sp. BMG 8361]
MEETISRMAGSENGSLKTIAELEAMAAAIGRPARQRTTEYRTPSAERIATAPPTRAASGSPCRSLPPDRRGRPHPLTRATARGAWPACRFPDRSSTPDVPPTPTTRGRTRTGTSRQRPPTASQPTWSGSRWRPTSRVGMPTAPSRGSGRTVATWPTTTRSGRPGARSGWPGVWRCGGRGPGRGWLGRALAVLDGAGVTDSPVHGYVQLPPAVQAMYGGDARTAYDGFTRAAAVGDRFGEADLMTLGRLGRGQALALLGDVGGGLALLDEAMIAVTTGETSTHVTGLVYCAVIATCLDSYDLRRAQEWTGALTRWCAAQPDMVPYRGQCLVHRAQILQLHGAWPDAMTEAELACAQLADAPGQTATGMAWHELGDLHRLRGEYDAAEAAYRRASRHGHDPQPGLALLRVAQGRAEAATAAIRRALAEEPLSGPHRPRLLAGCVEVLLAAGDLSGADAPAHELSQLAANIDAPLLRAMAMQATGAVLLARDASGQAVGTLRRAWSAWQELGAPYDAARTRVLIGLACRALDDHETAALELGAAGWTFDQLGARPDAERVAELTGRGAGAAAPGGLTTREVEVLRLVATGRTNRAIAGDLFLSEKTVARHVANIFTKIDVPSRAAATAYAYQHHLA